MSLVSDHRVSILTPILLLQDEWTRGGEGHREMPPHEQEGEGSQESGMLIWF